MTLDDKKTAVANVPVWFHSFDFGDGVTATGHKTPSQLESEWNLLRLPDLGGKSVLDINTWDGWFAIQAERHGASRVVGLDRYVWTLDLAEHFRYWRENVGAGTRPKAYHEMPYYHPDSLPGKIGFDTARRLIGSRVQECVADFTTMDLAPLRGAFDVVLYLGTLYHMSDPIGNLRRLYEVTAPGGLAVIETHAITVPGYEHIPLCESYGPLRTLNSDSSNWWGPNALALRQMLLSAGFSDVEITVGPPVHESAPVNRNAALRELLPGPFARLVPEAPAKQADLFYYRAFAHARR